MLSCNQFCSEFHVSEYTTPTTNTVAPVVMICGLYPETNSNNNSGYGNKCPVGTSPVFCQNSYAYPVTTFSSSSVMKQDVDLAECSFEAHDSNLKIPIPLYRGAVRPTVGSHELFSTVHQNSGGGSRNVARVCEPFYEGSCVFGDKCSDIHVFPSYLAQVRQIMLHWLGCKLCEFNQTLKMDSKKTFRVFCADLKEVVEVPITALTFTRGLYVDPKTRARRTRGGHQSQYALMASQVPTACGLFASGPNACKWGQWCNQVHINARWMQCKKNEFERWSKRLEMRFNELPLNHEFDVHDPQLKMCLKLPKASIAAFSRGLFQGLPSKAPSVCMLFQRNRCTASTCCNQIHVVTEYLQLHRRWVGARDQLSEDEQRKLWNEMQNVLKLHSPKLQKDIIVGGGNHIQEKGLNPRAQLYVPQHPQLQGGKLLNGDVQNEGVSDNTLCGNNEEANAFHPSSYQGRIDSEAVILKEQRLSQTGVKSSELKPVAVTFSNTKPSGCRIDSEIENNGGSSAAGCNVRNIKLGSSGSVYPLGEFQPVDTDDRSQSSLQGSYGNMSHTCRTHKRANNPYAPSGNTSCAASVNFGWVQPVASGGNSCTTVTACGNGGDGLDNSGGWASKAGSLCGGDR